MGIIVMKRTLMSQPLVSLLIPAYNAGPYLRECLDSIVSQTYSNLQVVVIDDGSTDSTGAICDEYASRYPFVEAYHNKNQGVAQTRNALLDKIRGEYFLFVDADDSIDPGMVDYLLDLIQKYNTQIAVCATKHSATIIPERIEVWNSEKLIKEFLYHKNINGALWNKLIKTDLVKGIRFRKGVYYGEDALFVWKFLPQVQQIVISNKPLYNYRSNPESISRQKWTPDRRGTGIVVWREICRDVEKSYPQYCDIAFARCAMEDGWALYFASNSGWPSDDHIKERQAFIKSHLRSLRKYRPDGLTAYLMTVLLAYCYGLGKLIGKIRENAGFLKS